MAAFEFPCRCGETLSVSEALVKPGGKVRCPRCKAVVDIPPEVIGEVQQERAERVAAEERKRAKAEQKARHRAQEQKRKEEERFRGQQEDEQTKRKERMVQVEYAKDELRVEKEAAPMERALARQKSYVGAAVLTFVLYCVFYLPGLIFNIIYLADAKKTARVAGQSPAGVGCLWALLVLGLLPLLVLLVVLGLISIGGEAAVGG